MRRKPGDPGSTAASPGPQPRPLSSPVFAPGTQVWLYCQKRKKGLSPKLSSQWAGPCSVLEQLSDVATGCGWSSGTGWWWPFTGPFIHAPGSTRERHRELRTSHEQPLLPLLP
ncbi:unnamed protein product [Lota lota]